ncbi:MAG: hypothetical protein N4A74_07710, partial [Carboxylicivirga sp.]|nr:hypothetical protein [Carboxylicivirga sp.]
ISSQQEKIEIKLQDIVMEFEAAEAILARLEDETQSRYNINLKNKEIIELRELLIVVNQDIASLEIRTNLSEELSAQKTDLLSNKIELENQLRHKLDSLYFYERRSDGIAIDHLLDNWLQTVINYESAKARLLAMETKRKEFEKLFNQFAPLGASLKRIEREIEVKEQSYLEILHHLGLARLKQQNEELMANMKVLDKPFLPIDAEPTKRKLLVLVMAVFTFLFTLLGIFGIELLDNTIKTPSRFEKLNVYPLAGVLPRQTKQKQDWDLLFGKGLKTLIDRINSKVITSDSDEPLIVQIFSHQEKEGKSYAIDQLSKALLEFNHKLISLSFGDQEGQLPKEKLLASDYRTIIDGFENYDLVLVEVPALADQQFFSNPVLLQSAQLNYVVVEASRNWSKADDFIRKQFEEQTQIKASAILNHTLAENMEELIGEIPKSRSKLRRFVKRIVVKR